MRGEGRGTRAEGGFYQKEYNEQPHEHYVPMVQAFREDD